MRRWTRLSLSTVGVVIPIVALAAPASAATTTVALWHMEAAGTMSDSSGNGNDGTTTAVNVVPDGVSGNAYEFAGPDSHVTVPDSPTLNPGTADLSYTVHVRFSVVPDAATVGDYDLIRKGLASTTGGEWKMEILPNANTGAGNPFCLFKDNAGHSDSIRGSQNLADGSWHTVTCVKTSSTNKLIVDGGTKTSTPTTPLGTISNTAPVVLGQKWGGGDQYKGDLDEVSIQIGQADTTAPTVTARNPAAGATGVATTTTVTATFSEPVQNVTPTSFTLTSTSGTAVPATVTYDSGTNTATLHPNAALAPGTGYTATLASTITDDTGNALTASSWSFTTAGTPDTTAPTVTARSPAAGATGVATSTTVTATFSEPVQSVSSSTFKLKVKGTTSAVPATVTYDSPTNTATLTPAAPLTAGTGYTVTLTAGIKDLAGNALTSTSWNFTTTPGTTTSGPRFTSGTPAGNATGVGPGTNVTATFSEKVQGVNGATFTVAPTAGGAPVSAAYTSNTAGTKWTLNPTVSLAKDTSYTVTLTSGITDTTGNALSSSPVTWQFLTGPAPTVAAKSPAANATGVAVTTNVSARFSEPVNNVTTSTFTLTSAAGSVAATVTRSGTTNTWILDPTADLAAHTTYTVTVVGGAGGIGDLAGNPLKTVTWSFTTA